MFAVQPFILGETTYVVLTDGRYEIAVQSDKLQVNGCNADDTAFETIVVFQRPEAGGNMGFGFKKAKDFKEFGGGQGVIVIANASVAPSPSKKLAGAGMLYVENGALMYMGSNGTVTVLALAWDVTNFEVEVKDEQRTKRF